MTDTADIAALTAQASARPDDHELVWGAEAIARAANLEGPRQAFYLVRKGLLEARHVGRRIVSTRGAIRRLGPQREDAPA